MNYRLDPELAPALAALTAQAAGATPPARGDWQAVRTAASAGLAQLASITPPSSGVTTSSFSTVTSDGRDEIELRWYTPANTKPGPAVVYAHGGGMLGGSVDLYDELVSWYAAESALPFLSVELRLAPEATSPTSLAEDVFAALTWLADHAGELGVDQSRIAIMGDSGGAGPTAGAAILARDRHVPVAKQILVYPMLDDRNTTPRSVPAELLAWGHDNNYTGWVTLLGDQLGAEDVSPVAAPARLRDFAGLAPAYIDVGDLDIFKEESIAYALGLARAGVPIELHVHPGAPHGFERFVPDADVARRAMADRIRAIATI